MRPVLTMHAIAMGWAVCVVLLVILGACERGKPVPDRAPAQLVTALLAQNPYPVSMSPDGTRILARQMGPADFGLLLLERGGRTLCAVRDRDVQTAPSWKPDGSALAFFVDHDGDQEFRMRVVDVSSCKVQDIPGTETVAPVLRWSPDGSRLVFAAMDRENHRRLKIVGPDHQVSPLFDGVAVRSGYIFSPDGTRIAVASEAAPGAVTLVSIAGGEQRQLEVVPGGEVRSLDWSKDGKRLLCTARAAQAEFTAVYEIDLATGSTRLEVSAPRDISGGLYLTDGFAYHVNEQGETRLQLRRATGDHPAPLPLGSAVVTALNDAHAYVLHTGRTTGPALYELTLATMDARVAYSAPATTGAVAGEPWAIPVTGGAIPAFLWRGGTRAAVVRVHGGPASQTMRVWDSGTQLLVRAGFTVVAVNYRGSTGYGAAFEQLGDDRSRADDVIAAGRHLSAAMGIPPERTYLLGHSYGARLAALAAAYAPEQWRGVFALSLNGRLPTAIGHAPAHVFGFHGAHDSNNPPGVARNQLRDVFSPAREPVWTLLSDEGHTYNRVETWARIYGALLSLNPD